jgi:flagellar hook protein FlgE
MKQFQTGLEVIGNNISNSSTTGYKTSRADFADTLSNTLMSGTTSTTSVQVGTGVKTAGITTDYNQGTIASTGVTGDMAISGNGYFLVKDPTTGTVYATRDGEFHVDSNNYLVNSQGYRVQGYNDSSLSGTGDIVIDTDGNTSTTDGATNTGYSVSSDGKITVTMSDGTSFTRGQLLLQSFTNPSALSKSGSNLYMYSSSAGPLSEMSAAGTNGLGEIQNQSLEGSNVDLTTEMTNMITTQRGFQANSKVVTTSDEILQDVVGLKR